jgi:hypothetical protein
LGFVRSWYKQQKLQRQQRQSTLMHCFVHTLIEWLLVAAIILSMVMPVTIEHNWTGFPVENADRNHGEATVATSRHPWKALFYNYAVVAVASLGICISAFHARIGSEKLRNLEIPSIWHMLVIWVHAGCFYNLFHALLSLPNPGSFMGLLGWFSLVLWPLNVCLLTAYAHYFGMGYLAFMYSPDLDEVREDFGLLAETHAEEVKNNQSNGTKEEIANTWSSDEVEEPPKTKQASACQKY